MNRELIYLKIKSLVSKFEANKYHYLSKNYLEEEVKIEFINPFFEALGWDVRNVKGLSPYEKDVVFEKGETTGHPDYNFRTDGQTKFFIEAKAPHEPLHKIKHVLQAKSYAWNTKSVFIVLLTDFEEFRLFDATIKPDPKHPDQGLIFELTYDQYLDNLDKLILLSKEEVEKGSLDKLILKDSFSKRLRKPVDEVFLEDISKWREELAKDIYKQNIEELEDRTDEKKIKIQVNILNEAVQKILDRLIFIRIAEDRKIIEPKSLLDEVEWWKAGGKRRDLHRRLIDRFMGWNQDFNGEILKPGPCDVLTISSPLLGKIIEGLYFPKCPYLFDVIGVELLGSIYERYLGKTIRATPKRVRIEEKPEVRKAGGVYYTPQYIVDYIVKNTVEKKLKGKTPIQIKKIKILDPASGSGSFLLTAYQTLIDYHLNYYEKHPEESGKGTLFPDLITDFNGKKRLSIEKKAQILKNNIFGVDIDPQAVEIAMMSLYLKCLDGEKDLPRKKELLPSLAKNIRCGNSLISFDIFDQLTLFDKEEKERINPFDWYSKSAGFGYIMGQGGFNIVIGNPPYVSVELISKDITDFYLKSYKTAYGRVNAFSLFFEKALSLLKKQGVCSLITSNRILSNTQLTSLRELLLRNSKIEEILAFKKSVFGAAVDTSIIIFSNKLPSENHKIKIAYDIVNLLRGNFKSNIIHQFTFIKNQAFILNLKQNENNSKIVQKIKNISVLLEEICTVKDGIILGAIKDLFLSNTALDSRYEKWLEGNEVSRYYMKWIGRYICYDPRLVKEELKRKKKKAKEKAISASDYKKLSSSGVRLRVPEIFMQPKILTRQNAKRLIGSFDTDNFFVKNSLHCILQKNKDYNLKYILGLINSEAMDFYFQDQIGSTGKIFSQMKIEYIKKLPIRSINFQDRDEKNKHDKIAKYVDTMIDSNKKKNELPPSSKRDKIEREIQIANEKIDDLVYELYGITEEERKIIEKGA